MKAPLLIFDLDGTLIDSRADLAAAVNHVRGLHRLEPLSTETVGAFVGDGMRKLVECSLADADIDIEAALAEYRSYYSAHATVHTTLYPGVRDGVCQLHDAGCRLVVLTNKPGEPSRAILRQLRLLDCFDDVIGGNDGFALKPAAAGIAHLLEVHGAERKDTWMIGDHWTDLAAAAAAGVRSALVCYGFGSAHGHEPTVYFTSFSELVGYFL